MLHNNFYLGDRVEQHPPILFVYLWDSERASVSFHTGCHYERNALDRWLHTSSMQLSPAAYITHCANGEMQDQRLILEKGFIAL